MKKVIYSIVFFMGISVATFAQNGGKIQHRDRKDLAKELNLSDEQKIKVKELNDTYRVKMDDLKKNTSLKRDELRKQMDDLSNQKHNEMKKILNEDQIAKLEARRENRKDGRKSRNDGRHQSRPAQMKHGDKPMKGQRHCPIAALNLTEGQQTKMKELNEKYAEKRKALRDEQHKSFEGILTADQKAKFDSLKNARPRMYNHHKGNRPHFNNQKDCCSLVGKGELSQEAKDKIQALRETFEKEKQAILKTRIAPEMQQKKIADLRKKFQEDKREIIKEAHQKK